MCRVPGSATGSRDPKLRVLSSKARLSHSGWPPKSARAGPANIEAHCWRPPASHERTEAWLQNKGLGLGVEGVIGFAVRVACDACG